MRETRSEPWFWRSADEFGRLRLENGSHQGPDEGVCLMEAVAWLAREPHSDDPACVCPVLGAFGRDLNDRLDVERRQRLKPLIPALVGTASDGHAEARGFMAMDWIVRTYTPAWLRLARLDSEADDLQSLPEIADAATLRGAQEVLDAAAARDAAREAAWEAAWAAAWAAAWDAAWDAARDAAWDAAREAAWAAAWDAAVASAGAPLEPTKRALQDSAVLLFRRMVERGAEERVVCPTPWATEAAEAW